jgi:hypothetical protein
MNEELEKAVRVARGAARLGRGYRGGHPEQPIHVDATVAGIDLDGDVQDRMPDVESLRRDQAAHRWLGRRRVHRDRVHGRDLGAVELV